MRRASLVLGSAVVLGAQLAPLDGRFWTHMLQHLLIGDLGPLLLCLGRRFPERPLLALPLWTASLVVWHVPALYDAALDHTVVHLLAHLCFLVAGIGVWSVLLGSRLRTPVKLGYVLVLWTVSLVLSQVFLWSGHSYYEGYTLSDQRAGGGVMLVEGSFVMLGVVVWLLLRLFAETEEGQRALEGR
jgi:cytochrome c oxidase assembly factor CtaG